MSEKSSNRSYGQGAQGEPDAPKASKVSIWTRLRYNFDNSIAKSGAFVGWMFAAMVVLSIVLVFVKYALYAVPLLYSGDPLTPPNFETFWGSFATFLGHGGEATWADRILGVLQWAVTITIAGSVTGFIVGAIQRAFAIIRKGKSPIIAEGHTLILGWSNRVFPILKELAIANANVRKPVVVIFSKETRDFMEDAIETHAPDLGKLKVLTRTGEPDQPNDLKRANVSAAKSIIVLDADETGDATVVSTVLAIKSVNSNAKLRIIAELDDANTAEALQTATNGQVISVRSHDVIARVTAQASRQPGLAAVTLDLLDFDGDEIYFANVPALAGKTYADALLAFNEASVIGLVNDKGVAQVNPKQSTKLTANTQIIAIAEDDDKVVYTGVREDIAAKKYPAKKAIARKPEHLLVIGWSSMGHSILTELGQYLPKGSTVHIVSQTKFVKPEDMKNLKFGTNVKVTHASVSGDIDDLIAAASAKKYNEVIVLGYRDGISESEADAQTLLTMLQMNQLFDAKGNGVEPTRLVAEILDGSKTELARVAAVDDLVVSDNLAALLIAQISENPALAPVFEDLFDADGAALNVKPVDHYATVGTTYEFAELVAMGRSHGESVIGYRVGAHAKSDPAGGVILNPAKNTKFKLAADDNLIVIGDVE
ncbi:MAG: CASTOR/POLLUX-related putative ion channel [Micrococcales bacterium]